jgi:phosphoribosylformylglycinamidine cyclo-ligase
MPGLYAPGDFDLVGTIVGVVECDKLITGNAIEPGDLVVGLPSLGLHTNGYSLARKICFDKMGLNTESRVSGLTETIGAALLAPHRSYFGEVFPLANRGLLKGIAHLTGGGFLDNIPRILPSNCGVRIKKGTWPILPLFEFLQKSGDVPDEQAYRVFNMGIGMVLFVNPQNYETVKTSLSESYLIGEVVTGEKKVSIV